MKKIAFFIILIFLNSRRTLFAKEIIDQFPISKNNLPIELIHFPYINLHISQFKAYHENYLNLEVIQPKEIHPDDRCNRPILIFLGGFVIGLDWTAYETLMKKLAQRNITVIYPDYLPASIFSKMSYILFGYDSEKLTRRIQKTVEQYLGDQFAMCKLMPPLTVYSHSFGTREAVGLANANQLNIRGMILDGVMMQSDQGNIQDDQTLCMDDRSKNSKPWNFPLSIIRYEKDQHMKPSTDRAFLQCRATQKQYFEIKNVKDINGNEVQADHFSPFSDSKEKRYCISFQRPTKSKDMPFI